MAIEGWMEPPELRADEPHLWWGRLGEQAEPGEDAPDRSRSPLSTAEEARAERFHRSLHALRFRARRIFLRRVLGSYLGKPPAELSFREGAHGKPALEGAGTLEFNLSHSGDHVLIGVSRGEPIGVDVERFRLRTPVDRLARQVLAEEELTSFDALPESLRIAAFFRIWTRKEAVLKVLGLGLSRDPRSFAVGLEEHSDSTPWRPPAPAPIEALGLLDLLPPESESAACLSLPGTDWRPRVIASLELR